MIIFGHSQGAAIAHLLRSYLQYINEDLLPHDIRYKTYCSGAPKPGNLYYAYDFDFITRMGWGFRIINSADWVPETPMSVQTLNDINSVNPVTNYKESVKDMPWLVRMYLNSAKHKMSNTSEKGVHYYQKYLGNLVYDQVRKILPQLKEPKYAPSNAYCSAGMPIVLMPDEEYQHKFKFTGKNVFVHHLTAPYLFLLKKYYLSDYKNKKLSTAIE